MKKGFTILLSYNHNRDEMQAEIEKLQRILADGKKMHTQVPECFSESKRIIISLFTFF